MLSNSLIPLSTARSLSGLTKRAFDHNIRPKLDEYKRGDRAIGVDPRQLDAVLKEYRERHVVKIGDKKWQNKKDSLVESPSKMKVNRTPTGTLTRSSIADDIKNHLASAAGII